VLYYDQGGDFLNIKTAIFDMDGTLVDSLMIWNVFWSSLGEKYCNNPTFRPTEEDDKKVRTHTLRDAMHLIHKNYQIGTSGDELLQFANELTIDFYKNKVELKPDVKEFLDWLKRQGVQMCVVSATAPDLIHMALNHCEITSYFSKIFSCVEIGKSKEFPDAFLVACNYFHSHPSDTWVFEDSFVAIETATKIGMPTVGIYDQYNFDQERTKQIATKYIAKGETLRKLIH
jgi:HAD superfamily phosphoserine phosphatase-like hydrolase